MLSFEARCALIAACASFLFGYQVAVLNSSIDYEILRLQVCGDGTIFECEPARLFKSLAGSSVFLAALLGSLGTGLIVKCGRLYALKLGYSIMIVGSTLSILAKNGWMFIFSRLICGFAVGIFSVAPPMYISEMSSPQRRGAYGTWHQLGIAIGVLSSVALGMLFIPLSDSVGEADNSVSYLEGRNQFLLFFLSAFPAAFSALIALVHQFFFPHETPVALVASGNLVEAQGVVNRIYGDEPEKTSDVFDSMKQQLADTDDETHTSLVEILKTKKGYLSAFAAGCIMAMGQQITGINAFITCSTDIFKSTNMSPALAAQMSTIMASIQVTMCLVAGYFIDRMGRRPLLIVGVFGQAIALSLVPCMRVCTTAIELISTISVFAFMVFYSFAAGPIVWVYIHEVFPLDIKAQSTSIASCLNWLMGWVIVLCTGYLPRRYLVRLFTLFSVTSFIFALWILTTVKETRGASTCPYVEKEADEEAEFLVNPIIL